MREFTSEADLKTFEGWMRYQAIDPAVLAPSELATWQSLFHEVQQSVADTPAVGVMRLRSARDEYRYGVAIEDGPNLWLTLWVRRSAKGEFFVLLPRGPGKWNPHASYHLDGNVHMKSRGEKFMPQKRQPLTGKFRGSVSLGAFYGHSAKGVGAVCDPSAFTSVIRVPDGILGPRDGGIAVDLVEPGVSPPEQAWKRIVAVSTFTHSVPNIVITVGCDHGRA
jgi:hypothetical protein